MQGVEKKGHEQVNVDKLEKIFTDKYHDLNLTQNPSAGQTGYTVVPTEDIVSVLNRLTMAATADIVHINQVMATIKHLEETNKTPGKQIKQISATNTIPVETTG